MHALNGYSKTKSREKKKQMPAIDSKVKYEDEIIFCVFKSFIRLLQPYFQNINIIWHDYSAPGPNNKAHNDTST